MWQVPGHLPPADPELEDGCGPRQEGDLPYLGHQPRLSLPMGNIRQGELQQALQTHSCVLRIFLKLLDSCYVAVRYLLVSF